jgi:hypothetical protein
LILTRITQYGDVTYMSMDGRSSVHGNINGMTRPVLCNCGKIYDVGKVTVTARFEDCTVWKTPCCGRQVDDRGETGWKSTQDYQPIDKNGNLVGRGRR